MSLFTSFEQGDIWSSNGFAFASPINDMLDREQFTLTELLDEDEVLQEVKSLNPKLITFLSSPESVREMVHFMTIPAAEDDSDKRKLKYPYMACEILCCEIPAILASLAGETPTMPPPPTAPSLGQSLTGSQPPAPMDDGFDVPEPPPRPLSPEPPGAGGPAAPATAGGEGRSPPRQPMETIPPEAEERSNEAGDAEGEQAAGAGAASADGGVEAAARQRGRADMALEGDKGGAADGALEEEETDGGAAAEAAEKEAPIMDDLFAMLGGDGALDVRLAGYMEKVMTVLLKHKCPSLVRHINAGGFPLFQRFSAHLDDFSVTQMARRLLLPKLASLQEVDAVAWQQAMEAAENATTEAEAAAAAIWVAWGADERVLLELVSGFQRSAGASGGSDLHSHLSELLLSLISQCLPNSVLLTNLYGPRTLEPLCAAAAAGGALAGGDEDARRAACASAEAALRILVALVVRISLPSMTTTLSQGSVGANLDANGDPAGEESDENGPDGMNSENIAPDGSSGDSLMSGMLQNGIPAVDTSVLVGKIIEIIPALRACLEQSAIGSPTISAQTKEEVPRLGSLRLQIARFFESLLRLGDAAVDASIMQANVFGVLLDLFARHENCTLLHQAVANAVVLCLVDARRTDLQAQLLGPCRLLERLLEANEANEKSQAGSSDASGSSNAGSADNGAAAAAAGDGPRRHARRLGYIGHAIMISSAIVRVEAGDNQPERTSAEVADGATGSAAAAEAGGAEQSADGGAPARGGNLVSQLVAASAVAAAWRAYENGPLQRAIMLQSQPLGGFAVPSREDENQLSMDFPEDALDMDTTNMMEQMAHLHMGGMADHGGSDRDQGGGGGGTSYAFGSGFGSGNGAGDGSWGQPGDDASWANFQAFQDHPDPSQGFQAFADFESAFVSDIIAVDVAPPQPPPRLPTVSAFADFAAFPEPSAAPPPPPPPGLDVEAFGGSANMASGPVAMEIEGDESGSGNLRPDDASLAAAAAAAAGSGQEVAAQRHSAGQSGDGLEPMEG